MSINLLKQSPMCRFFLKLFPSLGFCLSISTFLSRAPIWKKENFNSVWVFFIEFFFSAEWNENCQMYEYRKFSGASRRKMSAEVDT